MSTENNGIIDGINIFEKATREGFTYPTSRGPLPTEQVWQMHLTSKNMFDLDHTARLINAELKGITEESFVNTKPNPAAKELAVKLEIIKHIIAVKQAEAQARQDAAARAEKREKLVAALANQEDKELSNLTPEQIRAKLAELDQ